MQFEHRVDALNQPDFIKNYSNTFIYYDNRNS